jgi:chromosomal replication initiation ATPase DnaA
LARQLAFDLPVLTALGRDDFFVSDANALPVKILDAPQDWPDRKMLLIGPEGSGKSHLAQIWATTHNATLIPATDLGERSAGVTGAVVVDDADSIAGDSAAETALFHLHNLVLAEGGQLLITAKSQPKRWGLGLPDLASRMEATATATLLPPDDTLLAAVLIKLFADRQIAVTASLIPWLVARMDRSFATARKLVSALDALALAKGQPVSRTLASEVLDSWDSEGQ